MRSASRAWQPYLSDGMGGSLVHAGNLRLLLAVTAHGASATVHQLFTIAVDLGGAGPPAAGARALPLQQIAGCWVCSLADSASTIPIQAGNSHGTMPPVILALKGRQLQQLLHIPAQHGLLHV